MTLSKWSMYLVHIVRVIFFQTLWIPHFSSEIVRGLTQLERTLSVCPKHSQSAGLEYSLAHLLVSVGSLSCWNLCPQLNAVLKKGRRAASNMSVYLVAVKVPVKITIGVAPYLIFLSRCWLLEDVLDDLWALSAGLLFGSNAYGEALIGWFIHQSI